MGRHIMALLPAAALVLTCFTGCCPGGADPTAAPAAQLPAADSAASADPRSDKDDRSGYYNLFSDDERCGVILFVDGEAKGYNNYADGEVIRDLSNCLAEVAVTFRFEDAEWSLVHVRNMAESCNSWCWVRTDGLRPYDPASMEERLTYPVRVRPGTVLTDEVRGTVWRDVTGDCFLERRDGACFILLTGGVVCPVQYEDILFPRVEGNKILWD